MGKCVIKNCISRSDIDKKEHGITFHKVPEDPKRLQKWLKVIRLLRNETDWLPSKSTLVCSKHFRDSDKIAPKTAGGNVRLSKEAVPMLVEQSNLDTSTELPFQENMDEDEKVETDDEINEVTESPREHKMRKTINHLQIVCANQRQKIKNMSQKLKRMEVKITKYKNIIDNLRNGTFE